MATGRRDVERDLRAWVARDAVSWVHAVKQGQTSFDIAIDRLIDRAFGDPDRLRAAVDLAADNPEAQAVLRRAVRRAVDPVPPDPPRPFAPPLAPGP